MCLKRGSSLLYISCTSPEHHLDRFWSCHHPMMKYTRDFYQPNNTPEPFTCSLSYSCVWSIDMADILFCTQQSCHHGTQHQIVDIWVRLIKSLMWNGSHLKIVGLISSKKPRNKLYRNITEQLKDTFMVCWYGGSTSLTDHSSHQPWIPTLAKWDPVYCSATNIS